MYIMLWDKQEQKKEANGLVEIPFCLYDQEEYINRKSLILHKKHVEEFNYNFPEVKQLLHIKSQFFVTLDFQQWLDHI